jgi:hypothetical protein
MIIRWGKEEVVAEAAMKGNKRNNDDDGNEFLY